MSEDPLLQLSTGANVLKGKIANKARYWIADELTLAVEIRDRDYKITRTEKATLRSTTLRPGDETAWEFVIPRNLEARSSIQVGALEWHWRSPRTTP